MSKKVVIATTLAYAAAYVPYAYLMRSSGARHAEADVLPVYAVSCLASLAAGVAALRLAGRLPAVTMSPAAVAAGASSSAIMFSASYMLMSSASPILSIGAAKIGTLWLADVLDRREGRTRARGLLALTSAALLAGWIAHGWGGARATLGTVVACSTYIAGWWGKLRWSGPNKGSAGFVWAESAATVACSLAAGVALLWARGVCPAAWQDWRPWVAGAASEVTGVLGSALVLLPAAHGACLAISRGAGIAASVAAQGLAVTLWEGAAAALGIAAAAGGAGVAGNVSPRRA